MSPVCSAGDSVLEAQVELQKLAELVPGPVQPGPGQQLGAGQSSTTLEDTGTAQIRDHTETSAASSDKTNFK